MTRSNERGFVIPFSQLAITDVPLVGGKNASLGEMVRELTPHGIHVPNGFAVTATAYQRFLESSGLDKRLHEILDTLQPDDVEDLQRCGRMIRQRGSK